MRLSMECTVHIILQHKSISHQLILLSMEMASHLKWKAHCCVPHFRSSCSYLDFRLLFSFFFSVSWPIRAYRIVRFFTRCQSTQKSTAQTKIESIISSCTQSTQHGAKLFYLILCFCFSRAPVSIHCSSLSIRRERCINCNLFVL